MDRAVNAGVPSAGVPGADADVSASARVARIPARLRDDALSALLGEQGRSRAAKRRFQAGASERGIDLSLMWGVVGEGPRGTGLGPVCLAVLGAGRLAMLFVSPPASGHAVETEREGVLRAAAVRGAVKGMAREYADDVALVQGLPAVVEAWACRAFAEAGLRRITSLATLRRAIPNARDFPQTSPGRIEWGEGVSVRALSRPTPDAADRGELVRAFERSYEGTLDCPELCELRRPEDVLDSHLAAGQFTPGMWWVVSDGSGPAGCVLFSPSPEHSTVELVYLGLAPELRGRGLGVALLRAALGGTRVYGARSVICAVDERNAPARRLYERFGFRESSRRAAFVASIPRSTEIAPAPGGAASSGAEEG